MNDEQMKKMMEDTYDNSKEDSFISMLGDFYNKRTLWVVIVVWVWGIIFVIGAIYCGIKYYEVERFRKQNM